MQICCFESSGFSHSILPVIFICYKALPTALNLAIADVCCIPMSLLLVFQLGYPFVLTMHSICAPITAVWGQMWVVCHTQPLMPLIHLSNISESAQSAPERRMSVTDWIWVTAWPCSSTSTEPEGSLCYKVAIPLLCMFAKEEMHLILHLSACVLLIAMMMSYEASHLTMCAHCWSQMSVNSSYLDYSSQTHGYRARHWDDWEEVTWGETWLHAG